MATRGNVLVAGCDSHSLHSLGSLHSCPCQALNEASGAQRATRAKKDEEGGGKKAAKAKTPVGKKRKAEEAADEEEEEGGVAAADEGGVEVEDDNGVGGGAGGERVKADDCTWQCLVALCCRPCPLVFLLTL